MAYYNKLQEIRYSQVKPRGWWRDTLERAATGMPGHLHEIGYPFDTKCWEYKSMTDGGWSRWWPYEQMAYWIDGVVRMTGLLDDKELYAIVKDQIDTALSFEDSFIGPMELKEDERCYRWPIAVFARALYACWSYTGNECYLEKLRDHYLNDTSDYSGYRDIVNVETMLRLYEYFDDERLLKKAVNAYAKFDCSEEEYSSASAMLSEIVPLQHGVTYNEQGKIPAILYSYTGDAERLLASVKGYEKLERFAMLPDGVHTSCEFTYGNETKWAHESCDVSDYTWSLGYLLEATGKAEYADRIERAILNAAFGSIGPQFRTIQYFSSVNQVLATRNSTTIEAYKNTPRMAYQPHHYPECCVGNICRAIPNYVLRMYQRFEGGLCVSLYGDSLYDGEDIKVVQTGNYPFGDSVSLQVSVKNGKEGLLKLRIPYWAKEYQICKNNLDLTSDLVREEGYVTVRVQDTEELELRFKKEFVSKESADGGVYFEYGPFLLALKIKEKWEIDKEEKRQTKKFPAYNVYPASAWNYCVTGKEVPTFVKKAIEGHPYWDCVPFEVQIDARVLQNWDLIHETLEKPETKQDEKEFKYEMGLDAKQVACGATEIFEDLLLTPELPSAEFVEANAGVKQTITLVPYGCTNLRMTVFPKYTERG